jgi:hypothetical protein
MKQLALILCLLATATTAFGQAAGYHGFTLSSPLDVSIGTDRNFLIDRLTPEQRLFYLSLSPGVQRATPLTQHNEHDDEVMLLTAPTASFISDSRRRELSFSYRPEFEIFRHNSDQNSVNHDGNVSFSYWMGRRTNIIIRDAYRSSKDPSRTLQNIFLLLPRSRYQENAFRAQFSFDATALTNIAIRYDNTMVKFGDVDPFQVRVLDSFTNSGSLVVTRMLSQRQRLRGIYSIARVTPIQKTGVADTGVDTQGGRPLGHFLTAEYRMALNPSLVFELTGGLSKTEAGTHHVFRIFGDRRFGNIWIGGGYSRAAAFFSGNTRTFANGLKSEDMFEVASFQIRGEPFRRVSVQTMISASRSVSGMITDGNKAALGRARINFRLNGHMTTYVAAETYQQNSNAYVNAPLSRNRFVTGITYSFASEQQQRIDRLVRDAETVSLNEADRRNGQQ